MSERTIKAEHRANVVGHLLYELRMLIGLYDRLVGPGGLDDIDRNARIESFVVHFRNLHDFFFVDETTKHPKNVNAGDFVEDWERDGLKGIHRSTIVRDSAELANVYVVHLSYVRVEKPPAQYPWDFGAMLCGLRAVSESFSRQVRKSGTIAAEKLGEVDSLVAEIRSRCERLSGLSGATAAVLRSVGATVAPIGKTLISTTNVPPPYGQEPK